MRCKNCGWDNPAGLEKCEKCNAPLTGSMIESNDNRHSESSSVQFDPKKTVTGCPDCGYPIRPDETKCPNCGRLFQGNHSGESGSSGSDTSGGSTVRPTVPDRNNVKPQRPVMGTVIQGVNVNANQEGRKLVAFLVTYTQSLNGDFFTLVEGRNYIGKDKSLDICIQGDPKISGKHVSILYRAVDKKFKFKDELSSNGTFVNGMLADEGELNNHDVISIGSTKLIFIIIPDIIWN
jgi:hypothetical protein